LEERKEGYGDGEIDEIGEDIGPREHQELLELLLPIDLVRIVDPPFL